MSAERNSSLWVRIKPSRQRMAPPKLIADASTSTPAAATAGRCRRAHLAARSIALGGRARIGRFWRNRPRSSASSPAVVYRSSGSGAIALSTIVSRSRGNRRVKSPRRPGFFLHDFAEKFEAILIIERRFQS